MDKKKDIYIPLKAYNNKNFLNSKEARTIRILAEYLEPESRFEKLDIEDTIVFFGSARVLSKAEAKERVENSESRYKTDNSKENRLLYEKAKRDLIMSQYYEDARELAKRITLWSKEIHNEKHRFIICSGGGPGIMEAANKGAAEANGVSIGLNISLPHEQFPNPYITKSLSFEFHYFFMRKFWFFYLAKAMIVFPGGFGTMDEFFELITLIQTGKSDKPLPIVLYGSEYWNDVLNFDAFIKWGTISKEDKEIFKITDNVDDAFKYIKGELTNHYLR
jgi:uncharacterized protein (TIGR00730 family)